MDLLEVDISHDEERVCLFGKSKRVRVYPGKQCVDTDRGVSPVPAEC